MHGLINVWMRQNKSFWKVQNSAYWSTCGGVCLFMYVYYLRNYFCNYLKGYQLHLVYLLLYGMYNKEFPYVHFNGCVCC